MLFPERFRAMKRREIDAGPVLRRMKRLSERKKYGCAL